MVRTHDVHLQPILLAVRVDFSMQVALEPRFILPSQERAHKYARKLVEP